MMKCTSIAAATLLALLPLCLATACGSGSPDDHTVVQSRNLTPTISTLVPNIAGHSGADPQVVGLYNVNIERTAANQQKVSFRILTRGSGVLNVRGQEVASRHPMLYYSRVVNVTDANRAQTEADLHSFSTPCGVDVLIQVEGGGGMATSSDEVLRRVC